MKQKHLLILAGAFLLLAFIVGALVYNSEKTAESGQLSEQHRALLVREHAPSLGKADAKVQIVEFLDPACGTCASFYPFVKGLMAANPDRIRLFVRYAPFHDGSDQVVKILEAARKQGKYWQTLEALLASQSSWVLNHAPQLDLVWKNLESLKAAGLDLEQVRSDMDGPDIARLIEQDLADGRILGVTKTPEFFVNGRPMPSFGYEQLKTLVADAVAAAYR